MAEQLRHGARLTLSGPAKPVPQQAPKPRIRYYEILVTHADGQIVYRKGTKTNPNYRGIKGGGSTLSELVKRGLVSETPVELMDTHAEIDKANPTVATTDTKPDKAKQALDAARRSTYKPGTAKKPPAPAPRGNGRA